MDGRAASHTITDKIPFFLRKGIDPVVISAITGKKDEVVEHHQLLAWAPSGLKFDMRHWLKLNIKSKLLQKILKAIFSILLLPFYAIERWLLPLETHWSWFFPASIQAYRLAKQHGATLIYSTGGANSAHLAGYYASRWSGLPWIAEVHDPMIYKDMELSWMRFKMSAYIEKLICSYADRAWWFTTNALDRAKQRHPQLENRGFLVLPGAEEPDFSGLNYQKQNEFKLGHFGSLNPLRNLSVVIEAMSILAKENQRFYEHAKLHVYGTDLDSTSLRALKDHSMEAMVSCHGRLERDPETQKSGRQRVLEAMRCCDVLILLHGTGVFCEEYIPSKMYEYLWTRRPILALERGNPMIPEMLSKLEGMAVPAEDVNKTKDAIVTMFQKWEENKLEDRSSGSPYSTEKAVQTILEQVSSMKS